MGYSLQNIQYQESSPTPVLAVAYDSTQISSSRNSEQNVITLAVILSALQVLDGFLTVHGLTLFGVESEGNILLRTLMYYIGIGPTLLLAKSLAISVIFSVCYFAAPKVKWVPTAMKSLIAVYACAAVIPWTAILIQGY
jgi:hypothetical protein